ncbi:hypothetical protein J2Q11_12315 [Tenacibaculum finnmarkense genomovar finnmarkense]|uniref:hypothetical protein n=1 Tax=Tenacibaculum finnmarkense TaxID=2781243 RepID=UPI001EFAAD22|nr:hypothetical protein [Tenacibaculum finnmarkense]MCG8213591.1 hypothetical protein [Tenacibaculum finnmarkense genomovar finnmarkense]MCG8231914.1 hypothetical protein [Tenacibaculum finnmarkense genomovar finnmarkense]MCG8886472.1 hypothetical protein [Tenacibaculum finnmarkense]MCG8897254.1 hypothetical protein [Tenacibaculum finnmarkense]MCG8903968.1 hypothetical protein [Tenacibaculum finnmarkense]
MSRKESYWEFHWSLEGFNCFRKGKQTPRFILYWKGYSSSNILKGITDIELRIRPKSRKK